jgi:hypothetical protein
MAPPIATRPAAADAAFADALNGRGFGLKGAGAPIKAAPPAKPAPRSIRDGEVDIGRAPNGDAIGLDLGKAIAGRVLIQGNSGAGKSWLLRRVFEQAFGRVQQLLIDPEGEFKTLAEKFDVAVFSAAEALRVGGSAFARHLRQHRYSAVLDLSDATAEQQMRLLAEVATGLIEVPAEHQHALLVHVDEAQSLVPRYDPGDVDNETRARARAALAELMGRGRKRGLAGIVATSRIAETATSVIARPTNIIVGRTIFDRDLERCGLALGYTAGGAKALRTLADGEFICLGPAIAGPTRVRFRCGPVQSPHKGETPGIAAPPSLTAAQSRELLGQVPNVDADESFSGHAAPQDAARGPRNVPSRVWTVDEEEIVRDGYARERSLTDIANDLVAGGFARRRGPAICMRARALGLASSSRSAHNDWSEPEDEIVRRGYADKDCKIVDIVTLLAGAGFDRSRQSVQMRAIALGITRDRVNYYTDEEIAIAKSALEAGKANREIIADLRAAGYHRGVTSISKFAQKHGYDRSSEGWSTEQLAILRERYEAKVPVKQIAAELSKPIGGVRAKASNLGLKQRLPWTEAEYKMLRDANAAGDRLADVAERIGKPYPNVARVAATLQLDFRTGRTPRSSEATNG